MSGATPEQLATVRKAVTDIAALIEAECLPTSFGPGTRTTCRFCGVAYTVSVDDRARNGLCADCDLEDQRELERIYDELRQCGKDDQHG